MKNKHSLLSLTFLTLFAFILGCDSSSVQSDLENKIDLDGLELERCPQINMTQAQIALRVHNTSSLVVDSTYFEAFRQREDKSPPKWDTYTFPKIQPGSFSCPVVLDRMYELDTKPGEFRSYDFFRVSPWRGEDYYYIQVQNFLTHPGGRYTYRLVLNRYLEYKNRSILLGVDDASYPTLGVRIVNKMNSVVRNLSVHFPDTVLVFPELPANAETDYYMIPKTLRLARLTYFVGSDSIRHSPLDTVGESYFYSGLFRMEIDSVHYRTNFEEGFIELDTY